ncbi:acyl carrier protein [Kitasatospora kifunensis]|uniref:Acyl carrier protein n=1 Tax=Kitasatospora kifunensis TaxID=58351 RepID=A0A7W7R6V3_KITKI|nr:acyl carrier protein [Kitasatospora kifunensis]MBB4926183.1 acyl carrier protein [Kitasatospora kifunensis]
MFVDYLRTILSSVYNVDGVIEPTMSFEELELDSLSLAELGAQLEDDLGVTVDEENLTAATTVAEIAELLEAQGAVVPA